MCHLLLVTAQRSMLRMKLKQSYDVIVVGGGPGGISAAVSAAHKGVSVLLIERYGFLGGMATAGLVNPFMGFMYKDKVLASNVLLQLLEALNKNGGINLKSRVFDDELMKITLDNFVSKSGAEILLHSSLAGVEKKNNRIQSVTVNGKSGLLKIKGKYFIDSTGDGDLAVLSGAAYELGRKKDGLCQPMTLCFRIGGVKGQRLIPGELTSIFQKAKKRGEIDQPRENVLVFNTLIKGAYHFNTTRVIKKNGTNVFDLTDAEIEGRRQVFELFNLFKKYSPQFGDSYIMKMALQIGVRETRRIKGRYTMTVEDILGAKKFADGIARSRYPVDIHNPSGKGTDLREVKGDFYEIPYRCIVPVKIKNLLIGSRSISATHEAHSSLRVMPVVSGLGEAAGLAAAICVKKKINPAEVSGSQIKKEIFKLDTVLAGKNYK